MKKPIIAFAVLLVAAGASVGACAAAAEPIGSRVSSIFGVFS